MKYTSLTEKRFLNFIEGEREISDSSSFEVLYIDTLSTRKTLISVICSYFIDRGFIVSDYGLIELLKKCKRRFLSVHKDVIIVGITICQLDNLEMLSSILRNKFTKIIYVCGFDGIYTVIKHKEFSNLSRVIRSVYPLKINTENRVQKSNDDFDIMYHFTYNVFMYRGKRMLIYQLYNDTYDEMKDMIYLISIKFMRKTRKVLRVIELNYIEEIRDYSHTITMIEQSEDDCVLIFYKIKRSENEDFLDYDEKIFASRYGIDLPIFIRNFEKTNLSLRWI